MRTILSSHATTFNHLLALGMNRMHQVHSRGLHDSHSETHNVPGTVDNIN